MKDAISESITVTITVASFEVQTLKLSDVWTENCLGDNTNWRSWFGRKENGRSQR